MSISWNGDSKAVNLIGDAMAMKWNRVSTAGPVTIAAYCAETMMESNGALSNDI